MKRLCVVALLLAVVYVGSQRGWFVSGPPQIVVYPSDMDALQKSMYDSMDSATKSKWGSMEVKPVFRQMQNCARDAYGSTSDGKTLYVCDGLTKLELSLELAHLVDHASLMALGKNDHTFLDRSAVLAECVALKHFAAAYYDTFPICRASSSDVLKGKYPLNTNQVLGKNLKYLMVKADQEQP
jgi:hypothetical protein